MAKLARVCSFAGLGHREARVPSVSLEGQTVRLYRLYVQQERLRLLLAFTPCIQPSQALSQILCEVLSVIGSVPKGVDQSRPTLRS